MTALWHRLRRVVSSPGPTVGVEISATHVVAAALAFDPDGARVIGQARVRLPAGVVSPQATAVNLAERSVVEDALREALGRLPRRPLRIGLTIPDPVGKVSLVRFDQVPSRSGDLDRLIAWQVRKTAPFRVEEAQLTYAPGARHGDHGREFVVTLVRRDIVEEYEAVCAAVGVHAGLVDLTSFNLVNAALASAPSHEVDWLLVHVAPGYSTLAIVRGEALIFFRNRPTSEDVALADLVHQTSMYYEDHLHGRALDHVLLVDTRWPELEANEPPRHEIAALLEIRLGVTVHALTPPVSSDGSEVPSCLGGPLGLLARERAGAA